MEKTDGIFKIDGKTDGIFKTDGKKTRWNLNLPKKTDGIFSKTDGIL